MTENFLENRRQSFLTEGYFKTKVRDFFTISRPIREKRLTEINLPLSVRKATLEGNAFQLTDLLHLRYTAGLPIEKLRHDLDEVVAAWEAFAKTCGVIGSPPSGSIFGFAYRSDYLLAVQLVALTILMRREDLLARIDALCYGFRGADAVYEEMVSPFLPNRDFVDAWYHDVPYRTALNAIDSDDPVEQSALMQEAVESWYGANEGLPFHDTHKDIDDEGHGGYSGYWCFELAALCYLKQINDSTFREHITYPKDLVDFARQFEPEHAASTSTQPPIPTGLTAYPGDICPETGEWYAIHLGGKKTYIEAGQTMPGPTRNPAGNLVIWYLQRQG